MRIFWEVPIPELSREWLLDEHRTHHCLWALFKMNLKKNPDYKWNGSTLKDIKKRHDKIVKEMIKRGYAHNLKSEIDEGCKIVTTKEAKEKRSR